MALLLTVASAALPHLGLVSSVWGRMLLFSQRHDVQRAALDNRLFCPVPEAAGITVLLHFLTPSSSCIFTLRRSLVSLNGLSIVLGQWF